MLEQIKQLKTQKDYIDFCKGKTVIISSADTDTGIGDMLILENIVYIDFANYMVDQCNFHDFYLLDENLRILKEESSALLLWYNENILIATMSPLNEHTRKFINDLDEKLNELKEDLEDNYYIYEDHQLEQLSGELNDLQHRISTIQEEQGWLD